jgi:hypothetical protein
LPLIEADVIKRTLFFKEINSQLTVCSIPLSFLWLNLYIFNVIPTHSLPVEPFGHGLCDAVAGSDYVPLGDERAAAEGSDPSLLLKAHVPRARVFRRLGPANDSAANWNAIRKGKPHLIA